MSLKKVLILKIVWMFFAGLGVCESNAWGADNVYSEVVIKKIAQRIQKTLTESVEAQVFLDEDLTEAIKVLTLAEIKWRDSLSQYPFLSRERSKYSITLSKHLSMKGPNHEQVTSTLEILYLIKRQLEGSTLLIPTTRIKLFSQKFSPRLLDVLNSCSISTFPLPFSLSATQRDEFNSELVSLLEARGYSYESTWGAMVVWLSAKEKTDGGCNGGNRNLFDLSVRLINLEEQIGFDVASATGTSCGYSIKHKEEALKKLIKTMKSALPKCNIASRNN